MVCINLQGGEPLELSAKRFQRLCDRDGLLKEMHSRRFYKKKSEIRKMTNSVRLKKISLYQKRHQLVKRRR